MKYRYWFTGGSGCLCFSGRSVGLRVLGRLDRVIRILDVPPGQNLELVPCGAFDLAWYDPCLSQALVIPGNVCPDVA